MVCLLVLLERSRQLSRLAHLLRRSPVVAILGPRQVGKTTLARMFLDASDELITYFDLESQDDLARLEEPMIALERLSGVVVIDEIQRRPDLYPVLRVLVDRPRNPARFLVLGSASPDLLRQSSETLAGRIAFHELSGFSLDEAQVGKLDELWLRGGYPRSFLADGDEESMDWRHDFVRTYLERDVPQLGIRIPSETLGRFWRMLAHYHGQVWNAAEFARSFGVSAHTVNRYLDVLRDTFIARKLQPWHENIGKRQVKAPKVYLTDSGLLHALLGLESLHALGGHPKVGASWEGFVLEQIISWIRARPEECFFWRAHTGAEVDLLIVRGNHRVAFRSSEPPLQRPRGRCEPLRMSSD